VADPLGKVNPGDGFVIRADTWNAFIDAARAHRRNEAGRAGAGLPTPDPLTPGCVVYVRNDTGSTLPAWSTVKIGTPVVDAATYPFRVSREPVFPATTPDGADIPFAVTEEPIRDGKLGRAVVLGVAVADVSVSDSGHGYAAPAASSLVLASGTSGPARIIWKESGTGTLKAVVLIDRQGAGGASLASDAASPSLTISADNTWQALSATISLPSAGTYLLFATGQARIDLSGGGPANIRVRMYDTTNAATVPSGLVDTDTWYVANAPNTTGGEYRSFGFTLRHVASGAATIRLEAYRTGFGATYTTSQVICQSGGFGYVKLA